MRKYLFLVLGVILFTGISYADNDVYTTDVKALPENSRQFLTTHFNEVKVAHISIEKNWYGVKEYDVILTDGTEVEFSKSGEWEEIKRRNIAVPYSLLMPGMVEYIKTHFADNYVVSVEKDSREYEVKLNNGVELEFDLTGRLRDVDF